MPNSSSEASTQPSGDLFSVSGKVAVVTGGSRGIGAMIASGLVRAGCRVYITARKAAECDAKAAELSAFGECISVPLDLAARGSADELVRVVGEREDRLHILVNNAGASWGAPLEEYPLEAFDKVLNINVKALFELTVRSLPLLRAAASPQDPARVINIGSIDGLRVPAMETYAYSTTKAGVHMLTRHLAHQLAGRGPDHGERDRAGPVRQQDDGVRAGQPGHPRGDRGQRAARPDRPARRHGRNRHLPGRAGRPVPDRGRHPGRRRDCCPAPVTSLSRRPADSARLQRHVGFQAANFSSAALTLSGASSGTKWPVGSALPDTSVAYCCQMPSGS